MTYTSVADIFGRHWVATCIGVCKGAEMSDEIEQKRNLMAAHQKRLHYLELRAAQQGSAVDPAILLEIENIRNTMESLKRETLSLEKLNSPIVSSTNFLASLLNENIFIEKAATRSFKPPRDGFEWVRIPAGEFIMGSDLEKDAKAENIEAPQHKLYMPEFWISRYPVTNQHYKQFIEDTGYMTPKHWEGGEIPKGKELHPVVYVSWREAQLFCEWAYVRLPTEAEWEKAARGTDGRTYPWGDSQPHRSLCNFSNTTGTTPVGIFRQGVSPFGVFDMAGNIWEWTATCWGMYVNKSDFPYPYNTNDGRDDLNAPDNFARIIRGGGYSYYAHRIRCAARWYAHPLSTHDDVGFRVVRRN